MRSSGRVGGSEAGLGAPRASSGWTQSGWLEKKEGNDWKRLWCTVDGDQVHCFETEASMGGKTAHTRLASDLSSASSFHCALPTAKCLRPPTLCLCSKHNGHCGRAGNNWTRTGFEVCWLALGQVLGLGP
mgnify:CR=1 FL=1